MKNEETIVNITGVDFFFGGYKSSVLKVMNELKNQYIDSSKNITYKKASETSPIYRDNEYCINIKFISIIKLTATDALDLLTINNMIINKIIQDLNLKNIEYFGSEFYVQNDTTIVDSFWKDIEKNLDDSENKAA